MKEINVKDIESAVRDLCIKANIFLPESLKNCIKSSTAKEESQTGIEVLLTLLPALLSDETPLYLYPVD